MSKAAPWEDAPLVEDKPWEAAPIVEAKPPAPSPGAPPPSATRAGVIGFTQGALADFGDEIGAALGQFAIGGTGVKPGKAAQPAPGDSPILRELKQRALAQERATPSKYQTLRDVLRSDAAAAREAHPEVYVPLEMGGAVASMAIPGVGVAKGAKLAQTAGKFALLGGATGLGSSGADLTRGRPEDYARAALDTSVGIGVGGLGGVLGHGIEKGAQRLGQKLIGGAAERVTRAEAKAAQMAADATEAEIASAKSAAGRAAQDAYKQLEHLRELKALRGLTPEEKTVFADLSRELGTKAQAKLLPAAAEKAATATAYGDLVANRSTTEATKAAELLKPTVGKSVREWTKAYGEPIAASVVGGAVGHGLDKWNDSQWIAPVLAGAAGIVGGRTRGGKFLYDRIAKPGNQVAISEAQRALGSFLSGTGRAVGATERAAGRTSGPVRAVGGAFSGAPQVAGSEPPRPGGLAGRYLDALDTVPEMLGKYGPVIARETTPDARLAMTEALIQTDPEFAKAFEEFRRSLQTRQGRRPEAAP